MDSIYISSTSSTSSKKGMNSVKVIFGAMIVFLIGVIFYMSGLFPKREVLPNKTRVEDSPFYSQFSLDNPKKIVLVLLDAFREDFAEIKDPKNRKLEAARATYKGRKVQMFQNIADAEPENTFFAAMRSELPTVTAIRVKSLLTGALNSLIEVKDNFGS
jgi:predicted AlkP superfamily pyrophosphatase or phosphodiesterase